MLRFRRLEKDPNTLFKWPMRDRFEKRADTQLPTLDPKSRYVIGHSANASLSSKGSRLRIWNQVSGIVTLTDAVWALECFAADRCRPGALMYCVLYVRPIPPRSSPKSRSAHCRNQLQSRFSAENDMKLHPVQASHFFRHLCCDKQFHEPDSSSSHEPPNSVTPQKPTCEVKTRFCETTPPVLAKRSPNNRSAVNNIVTRVLAPCVTWPAVNRQAYKGMLCALCNMYNLLQRHKPNERHTGVP